MPLVYDASALLAVVFSEPGAEVVVEQLSEAGGAISAANWAEVGSRMIEHGLAEERLEGELGAFSLAVIPLDEAQALAAARLRRSTRSTRSTRSLGDRCCLALAQTSAATIVTADRVWKKRRLRRQADPMSRCT